MKNLALICVGFPKENITKKSLFDLTLNYIFIDYRIVRLNFLGAAVMFRGTGLKKNMNVVTTIIPLNAAAARCAFSRRKLLFILLILLVSFVTVCAQNPAQGGVMKIKITMGNREITATISDNAAARDFISLLPLNLTLTDYNRTEKVSGLPQRLNTAGTPSSYTPVVGDICYYAPWGSLCIFYRPFSNSSGLVLLGKIDNDGIEAFTISGSLTATIEVIP